MPSFFTFQQGSETRGPSTDSSPLLGRFRAVPNAQRLKHRNSLLGRLGGTRLYGSFGSGDGGYEEAIDSDDDEVEGSVVRRWGRLMRDLWLEPKQAAVGRLADNWLCRWGVMAVLPAVLVSAVLEEVIYACL